MTDDPTPEVDLDALLDAMKAAIAAQFPALKTVDDYYRLQDAVKVPAVALEITGIEHDGDIGTEQFAAIVTFSAYCIVSYKADAGTKAKRRAASLAASVAAFVKTQTWGCPVQLAADIAAVPDVYPAKAHEYEAWRVDWQHECLLGTSVWEDDTPQTPPQMFLGIDPDTGPPNVADYERIV